MSPMKPPQQPAPSLSFPAPHSLSSSHNYPPKASDTGWMDDWSWEWKKRIRITWSMSEFSILSPVCQVNSRFANGVYDARLLLKNGKTPLSIASQPFLDRFDDMNIPIPMIPPSLLHTRCSWRNQRRHRCSKWNLLSDIAC